MIKISSYAVAIFIFFTFCCAEAAVFNVTNVAEFENALATAQGNGEDDTINLAPGIYTVSSPLNYMGEESENFSLTIQGGGADTTLLDGGNATSILRIEQGYLSDGTNANVTIRGVTFQNGSESSMLGGALYIGNYYAQTTIEDSVFEDNTAVSGGGALYLNGWTSHLNRNIFTGNSSTDLYSVGGAVYVEISGGTLSLVGNAFINNFCVGSGAGLYATDSGAIVLTGNTFTSNVAGGEGGGAYLSAQFGGSLTLSGNTFKGNSGSSSGGVSLASDTGPIVISGNIFRNNVALASSQSNGGGLTAYSQNSLKMVNNLFAGNTVSERGAGAMLHLFSNENPITNNTFVGNSSTGAYDQGSSQGAGMYVITDRNEAVLDIYNNIFWNNTATAPSHGGADFYINDDGLNDGVGSTVNLYNNDYSDKEILRGDHLFQGGNINAGPMFDADYRLTPGSPCMDTGNNSAPGLAVTDLGGDPRIQDGKGTGTPIVDMGAYEWWPRGLLQVTISPQGAIDAGAKWRLDGGVWQDSGYTQTVLVGSHTVEFSSLAGWTKPGDQTVTISNGQTTNASGSYTPTGSTGSLQVTISPQGAIDAGAKWQVDGGIWHVSGYTQTDLSVGSHTVWFSDVPGLTKPTNQTVTISAGHTASATGTYTGHIGSLRVTISPQGAIDAGAKWQVDGGPWHVSGETQTVSAGSHTVHFSDVATWRTPANKTLTIIEGQTTNTNGNYTQPTGSLQVTISPQGAIDAGAKWRRVGTSVWRNSGTTETLIPVGTHTVEFSDVAGWTTPGNRTVTISENHTTSATGTYTVPQPGSLMVTITPQAAIDLGAQWRVDGGVWQDSVYTQTGLSTGQHTLAFSDVPGWAKPGDRMVTISSGKTTAATGNYTTDTGSLQVTISPQGAIDAGAKWQVDGGVWQASGYTQAGLSVGLHMLAFSDLANWTKPGTQTVMITKDQTTAASGTYVPYTGSLQVTITPQGAIDAGAKWRRVGTTTWLASGTTETGILVGGYTVEFGDVVNWTKPGSQAVTISKDQTATTLGAYVPYSGSLQVTISPQGAIDAGAKWRRIGTATWFASGATETGILVGGYTVEFIDVVNWTKPGSQAVTITKDQTTTASGTYVPYSGSLQVTISPQGAIDAGAKWRRVGTATWFASGATESGILIGGYSVEFSDVVNWTKPGSQAVTITKDQTTTASGTYVPYSGSLQVTISPQGAIDAGAKWRRVGTSTWFGSGATETGILIGGYTVEFSDVVNWTKPGSQAVTITKDQTTTASGTYVPYSGSLQVTISPQGAIDAGAKWRRVGTATWFASGATESGIFVGGYTVEFSDVVNWTTPGSQAVTITKDQTTTAWGIYVPYSGSLQVTISPQGAIDAGAKWRRVGTSTWFGSGATESGILIGGYSVEFSDVVNWTKPGSQAVTITKDQTTTASGTYVPYSGSLQVTISPQGAIDAGAKWRRVGTATWFGSGATETGILIGGYSVEFSDVVNWTKPGNQAVTITKDQTTTASGTYVPYAGSLQVTISPQGAIDAGAKWRRVGTATWFGSGATETGILIGGYTVEFSDVVNWTKPGNQAVTITKDQTTTASGTYVPYSGSLHVTISPQGAIDAGAKWRRVGTATWFGSGATETGILVGGYSVEFSDVVNWTKPGSQAVTITKDQTTTASGTYVPYSGSLQVTISPQGAIDAGAKWRRVGTSAWFASGATETGILVGGYSVEFSDVANWAKPGNQAVTIAKDQTTTASGTYVQYTGSLQVTISPQGAIDAGAKWRRVGTATWFASGATETGILIGAYSVEFSDVVNWTKPGNQAVTIAKDQTATASGTYVPYSGSLQVTISPQGAINAGAKWRRVGTSTWFASGATETGILIGGYSVEFSDVANWAKPGNQAVTIAKDQTATASGTYVPYAGSLQVTISPQAAIDAGAKWRRVGTATWFASGATETGILVGVYTLEFSDVANWAKPGNQAVTITKDQTTTASGTYVQDTGSLQVTISPQGAIDAGAKWRRVGTSTWRASEATETGILIGGYSVEFNDVVNWTKPGNQAVTIAKDHTTTASGTYIPYSGSLQVTISPQGAIDAGAKWRRVGTATWFASGATETGILIGGYSVEFSDVVNWTKPGNQAVTIAKDQTATASGTYVPYTGSLQVTITPSGAVDAGAKWRRVGTSAWFASGATETGIPVGGYTVEFSDVGNWTKPGSQAVTITKDQLTTASGTYVPYNGSLQVTISPQGAIDAGAKWRRVGTATWFASGATESGILIGGYTVEFSDVVNWTKPGNQAVTITKDQTATASGTYVPYSGSLQVTISPQGAIDAGAKWRRVGTSAWFASGATETGIFIGAYTVEFSDAGNWAKPGSQAVTIAKDQTTTASATYVQDTGSLQVTITPSGAVDAGAKWRRVGTGAWFASGATETGISVGGHTVEFSDVVNWTKPGSQPVTITKDQTTTASGTYVPHTGSLQVAITPQCAVDAGAKWRRVGASAWFASGATETGIFVGAYTVEFSDVMNWTKPGSQAVTIAKDQTTNASGTYVSYAGSLQVTISPQGAIDAGAQWRVSGVCGVGMGTWRSSGATEPGIPVGTYTVEFSDVVNWTKPGSQAVTITKDQTTTASGAYVPYSGSLQVTITPSGAVDAGAKWRRVGTGTWLASGATETGISVGAYTVEFSDVVNWARPGSQAVTIAKDQTTTASGTYVPYTGSLQVNIAPSEAVDAGAKWRRVGTTTWLSSGSTETGILVGGHTVEFNRIGGWTKPTDAPVTISKDVTTALVGNFNPIVVSFPFFDDFSTDKGWSSYEPGGWERGPAHAGTPESGNPDPATDYTQMGDNYILGYAIGEDYPNNLSEKEIISPAIDCTGQDRVFLKFWRYLNVDGSEFDHASISVSNDRTNWVLIWENPESATTDSNWTPVAYDISEIAAGQGSVFIKFTMGPTDSTGRYSGWNIDDLEVTSNPLSPAEGTIGTQFSITGSGFGAKKGKVLLGDTSLKVLGWEDESIDCRLGKTLNAGVYDVTILAVAPKGSHPMVQNAAFVEAFAVKPPEMHSISKDYGTAGQMIMIGGKFFGTTKGKVYLAYREEGKSKKKSCHVASWTMDPTTSEGYIVFAVPKGLAPGTYDIVVTNSVGSDAEPGGFTIE